MTWSSRARRFGGTWPPRLPPALADVAIIGSTGILQVLSLVLNPARNLPLAGLLGIVQTVPLVWRRRWPLAVLAALAVSGSIEWLAGVQFGGYLIAVPATVYSVGFHSGRRRWLLFWGLLIYALYSAISGVVAVHDIRGAQIAIAGVGLCAAFLVGDNARMRVAQLAELETRLARQEVERTDDRRRATEAERLRIARELHDVVAHHVSAIAVEAEGERAARPNDAGADVMSRIAATARVALTELSQLLGVLRRQSDRPAPRAPEPGLGDAQELVSEARAAGLDVRLAVSGIPRPLPEALDLSAYRIVQEGITNARKHAGGASVEVCVRYGRDRLEIRVTDNGAGRGTTQTVNDSGHGLVGMRERAEVFGGSFQAGPLPVGGFRVAADLPIEPLP